MTVFLLTPAKIVSGDFFNREWKVGSGEWGVGGRGVEKRNQKRENSRQRGRERKEKVEKRKESREGQNERL